MAKGIASLGMTREGVAAALQIVRFRLMSVIACDLSKLDDAARRREQQLLREFVTMVRQMPVVETENGFRFTVAADPGSLSRLGEFIALERLCCPFLTFSLEVADDGATLHVFGPQGAKAFLASVWE
jgi:hypothetical protein